MTLTESEWQQAAAACDISPEDLVLYREAFSDIERLGLEWFLNLLTVELHAAIATKAPPDQVNRLVIRRIVAVEVTGIVAQQALAAFDGPVH